MGGGEVGLGGGGGVDTCGDDGVVWPAAMVNVTGMRWVVEKLFGPESTMYTVAEYVPAARPAVCAVMTT